MTRGGALGPGKRAPPLPLRSLLADVQRPDEKSLVKLRMKDECAVQTSAMIDGVNTAQAARRCGVHYTTAFH